MKSSLNSKLLEKLTPIFWLFFSSKRVFDLLESKNIFPSLPTKKKILFIPIIFDQNKNEILMFSENYLFNNSYFISNYDSLPMTLGLLSLKLNKLSGIAVEKFGTYAVTKEIFYSEIKKQPDNI